VVTLRRCHRPKLFNAELQDNQLPVPVACLTQRLYVLQGWWDVNKVESIGRKNRDPVCVCVCVGGCVCGRAGAKGALQTHTLTHTHTHTHTHTTLMSSFCLITAHRGISRQYGMVTAERPTMGTCVGSMLIQLVETKMLLRTAQITVPYKTASTLAQAGRSGDRIPLGSRFPLPV
jgi:hypothetical protein